jgi:membrane associated rhomboid family serine protease
MRVPLGSGSTYSYQFGPGPLPPAIKLLILANVVVFVAQQFLGNSLIAVLGFSPAAAVGALDLWQFATYMFLHGGVGHILFNMLGLWMFGTELERLWGSSNFLRYYFVCGVGGALMTVVFTFLPVTFADDLWQSLTIGASGAVYGVLLAFGMYFPNRPILVYFLFPIPAKYFVMIFGGIALLSSLSNAGGGVAHTTHLGGLVVGYLYLRRFALLGGRRGMSRPRAMAEIKYRYLKWKIDNARKRFDVYPGGRDDDRIH